MKRQIAILYVLVSLCLVFSLVSVLVLAQDHGFFAPTKPIPAETPNPTQSTTPDASHPRYTAPPTAPPATPSAGELSLSATETKQDLRDDRIRVTYTINAHYTGQNEITIKHSQFYLQSFAPRMIFYMYRGTINPQTSGTTTLSPQHQSDTFQVTFEFGTAVSNGMDQTTAVYQLKYNGTATTDWPEPYS